MPSLLQHLQDLGFDRSSSSRDEDGRFSKSCRVGCSQCEAAAINGVPCHETGCPNIVRGSDEDNEDSDETEEE